VKKKHLDAILRGSCLTWTRESGMMVAHVGPLSIRLDPSADLRDLRVEVSGVVPLDCHNPGSGIESALRMIEMSVYPVREDALHEELSPSTLATMRRICTTPRKNINLEWRGKIADDLSLDVALGRPYWSAEVWLGGWQVLSGYGDTLAEAISDMLEQEPTTRGGRPVVSDAWLDDLRQRWAASA
jgi:hypothetical protein